MSTMRTIKKIIDRENQKYLILLFYLLCFAFFIVAFSYRHNLQTAFRFAGSVGAMADVSGALLWVMALLLHWKTFWQFFVAHSVFILLSLVGSYWFYAYSIESSNPFLKSALIDYLTYLRFTALCPAMSIVRYALTRKPDD